MGELEEGGDWRLGRGKDKRRRRRSGSSSFILPRMKDAQILLKKNTKFGGEKSRN